MKKILSLTLAFALILGITAIPALAEPAVIKIGVVGENNEQWEYIASVLKEEGIIIELVKFADYSLPNPALNDGEIDLNAFQHYAFLKNQSEALGLDLSAVGTTLIAPLGLYSQKIKSVDELKEGDKVALPNDATNGGRALLLLAKNGLITLKDPTNILSTIKDITGNDKNLKFRELEAATLPRVLTQVDLALINTNYALEAKLDPSKDALVIEGSDSPYVNILVTREDNKDADAVKKLVAALHTPEVKKFIEEKYKGAIKPAF